MKKQIIKIDEELCIGCSLCADTCHQDAIAIVDGKAKLMREDFCDGLGRCLPKCPTNAITFIEKEIEISAAPSPSNSSVELKPVTKTSSKESQLNSWPIEIQLVSPNADFFNGAHLLVAADCTAFAYSNFHNDFMKDRVVVIGCPKLDHVDYSEKLTAILAFNDIKSVTVARMEVPCCSGIARAAELAVVNSGKDIPIEVHTISRDGKII